MRAIEEARQAGLGRYEIGRAQDAVRALGHTQVVLTLRAATMSKDCEELRRAAQAAVEAGIATPEVDAAWERLRVLESLSWMRRQLQAAVVSDDAAQLQAAIRQAEAEGFPRSEIEAAQARLNAWSARARAKQELQLAHANGDAEMLRRAVQAAERAGLTQDELDVEVAGGAGHNLERKRDNVPSRTEVSYRLGTTAFSNLDPLPCTGTFYPSPAETFILHGSPRGSPRGSSPRLVKDSFQDNLQKVASASPQLSPALCSGLRPVATPMSTSLACRRSPKSTGFGSGGTMDVPAANAGCELQTSRLAMRLADRFVDPVTGAVSSQAPSRVYSAEVPLRAPAVYLPPRTGSADAPSVYSLGMAHMGGSEGQPPTMPPPRIDHNRRFII